jgi:hypothetical protein
MMEIIARVENVESTGSVDLDKAIATIRNEIARGNTASHNIARELFKIKRDKLFTAVGAEHFSDFAENYFGISKSQGSRLCSIAEKFLMNTTEYEDYSNTQLIAMMNATDEMLEYIKPTMTVKDIQNYIKGAKALVDKSADDTAPTDTAPTDTAPTDTAPTDTAPTDTAPTDTAPIDNKSSYPTSVDMSKAINMHFADEKELSAFLVQLAKDHKHMTNIVMTFIPHNGDNAE